MFTTGRAVLAAFVVSLFLVSAAGHARSGASPAMQPLDHGQAATPGALDGGAVADRARGLLAQAEQTADDGFEPISELPADERLPAAPMLVAAYIFALVALFLYVLSLSRRLAGVKQEIARLESDMKRSSRS